MVQSAETGKTTTMLRFREIRHTASLVNLRCAILRFVVHTNDFYRIFTLHLAQRPETGEQMFFLIVSDERYSDKRFVTLQSGQIAAYFLDNGLRSFRKGFSYTCKYLEYHSMSYQFINFAAVDCCWSVPQTILSTVLQYFPFGSVGHSYKPVFPYPYVPSHSLSDKRFFRQLFYIPVFNQQTIFSVVDNIFRSARTVERNRRHTT